MSDEPSTQVPLAPPSPSARPERPVPPSSRARWHVAGLLLTVIGGPLSFLLIAGALPALTTALTAQETLPRSAGLTAIGALLLAVVAWLGHRSSVGAATAGAVWLAAGTTVEIWPSAVTRLTSFLPEQLGIAELRSGAAQLLMSGGAAAIGAALVGVAIATSSGRARGRTRERYEQRAVRSGDVRVPPRSRLGAHVTAVAIGLVLTVPAVATLNAAPTLQRPDAAPADVRVAVLAAVLAILLTGACGFLSSLGPAVASALWLASSLEVLLGGGPSLVTRAGRVVVDLVPGALEPAARIVADASGVSFAVALTLLGGTLGAHFARRDGRRHQRLELELSAPAAGASGAAR